MGSIVEGSVEKPFEGAEKLLEITFQCSKTDRNAAKSFSSRISQERIGFDQERIIGCKTFSLLSVDRSEYEKILDKVNCSIINECHSSTITAYLLSESSLFIFEDKLIAKTCGKTNLLNAIDDFIQLGKSVGFESVAEIFYSRPKFLNPDDQPFSHRKFKRETQILLNHFNNGLAHVFGSTNADCYHLFCFSDRESLTKGCTLEIIMNGLSDDRRQIFFKNSTRTATDVTQLAGFHSLFGNSADVIIDDYLFDPCGYSLNGIIDKTKYFTVHVTPEENGSYASFETDCCDSVQVLVEKVVQIFKPSRFFVALVSDDTTEYCAHKKLKNAHIASGYNREEFLFSEFNHHHATFARFKQF